jgi:heme/copper-type cytochrome/quinol oxidase subunit 2
MEVKQWTFEELQTDVTTEQKSPLVLTTVVMQMKIMLVAEWALVFFTVLTE